MNWIALQTKDMNQIRYVQMQCIKKSSTVRVSKKGDKPIPEIVFAYGSQNGQIFKFLETMNFVNKGLREMERNNV
jgi:hypothetical protein